MREEYGFLKLPPTLEESTPPHGLGQAFKCFWVRLGGNAFEQASPEPYRRLVCALEEFFYLVGDSDVDNRLPGCSVPLTAQPLALHGAADVVADAVDTKACPALYKGDGEEQ